MQGMDFQAHNREVEEVWSAYNAGAPIRVPMILGVNPRYYIFSSWLNPRGITFEEYSKAPNLMMETQLEFHNYMRHHLLQDAEMGLPKDAWPGVWVDLQNYYEAAWFGASVRYHGGQVPDTEPILTDDRKNMLFDSGIPDPLHGGIMQKNLDFWEYMKESISTRTYKGLPIKTASAGGLGTDGPFTVAANLRGATEICLDLYEAPDYVIRLLNFITEATIIRIKAWRKLAGADEHQESYGFADDSIQLISTDAYKEFVLPFHKRLVEELGGRGPHAIHLCGDATRHFKTIRDELNVKSFDTGFPVDFGWLREELGPDVNINGGPSVQFLAQSTPDQVKEEVRRILSTGIMEGGKFVLREGNNLPPNITEENVAAMYSAVREYGRYA